MSWRRGEPARTGGSLLHAAGTLAEPTPTPLVPVAAVAPEPGLWPSCERRERSCDFWSRALRVHESRLVHAVTSLSSARISPSSVLMSASITSSGRGGS